MPFPLKRIFKKHLFESILTICHVILPLAHLSYEFNFGDLEWSNIFGWKGIFELLETVLGTIALYVFCRIQLKSLVNLNKEGKEK